MVWLDQKCDPSMVETDDSVIPRKNRGVNNLCYRDGGSRNEFFFCISPLVLNDILIIYLLFCSMCG